MPTKLNDPRSGNAGYPQLQADNKNLGVPLVNKGDVDTPTQGLGQSYFLNLPDLAVLGMNNKNGEPHLDRNYPGYNFNISDQRRAQEFIRDSDRMVAKGTLPQFLHIYQPNDHTGSVVAPNKNSVFSTGMQQVADADVALGMVVQHIMQSKIYYDPATGEGSALFVTYDDAQSCKDHIHPHRSPLLAISPYIKPGYLGKHHYVSASIVKTEELLLGLPPNNYGDLFATDLRDLFQPDYNGIKASDLTFTRTVRYTPSRRAGDSGRWSNIWILRLLIGTVSAWVSWRAYPTEPTNCIRARLSGITCTHGSITQNRRACIGWPPISSMSSPHATPTVDLYPCLSSK